MIPDIEKAEDQEPETTKIPPTSSNSAPYSTFGASQKRLILFLVAFAATFSPLSSFIYYPAITSLSNDLHVSIELINLTITSYMVVSGIAPAIIGDVADMTGRRWVYILTMGVYCVADIGLAVQRSWLALLLLRMLQSMGSSATISLAYGVVADIASPAERGSFVGAVIAGPNVAPSLGPVIGGDIAQHASWRWIFWLLALLSGFCLLLISMLLPETSRNIVGNGSLSKKWYHESGLELIYRRENQQHAGDHETQVLEYKSKCHIPNPISCLKLLFHRNTALIVLINSIFYMTYGCIQASMSSIFIELYGLSKLNAGLIYLPFGVGCAIASYLSGRIMNLDYRLTAKEHNITVDKVAGDDMAKFPIEKARFRRILYFILISAAGIVGYGWSLHAHTVSPLEAKSPKGLPVVTCEKMCGTLLVDLNPKSPATAQAALNIIRCSFSAGGLAVLQILIERLGVGWCFTLFSGFCLGMLLPV
ncbi:hypothetical protein NHQ30_004573 [Ciborinia camelliae]|nr:hypothetical protein NHQ30_004573 [Ciborinia camelliae]